MPTDPTLFTGSTLCAVYHFPSGGVLVVVEKSRYRGGEAQVTGGPFTNAVSGNPVEVYTNPEFIEMMTLTEALEAYRIASEADDEEEDEPWKR